MYNRVLAEEFEALKLKRVELVKDKVEAHSQGDLRENFGLPRIDFHVGSARFLPPPWRHRRAPSAINPAASGHEMKSVFMVR